MIQAVLFDLDGTLIDPAEGITRSIQYALEKLGHTVLPQADLLQYIGPPLRKSFATLLQTDESAQVELGVATFRERFATVGLLENELYAGIPVLLQQLRDHSLKLFIATSKPHVYARRILAHLKLESLFDGVYGSELDGRHENKGELLAYLLAEEGLAAADCVMVGDREHDIWAARQNGMRSIGVTYGYGTRAELDAAAADWLCDSPATILQCLTPPSFSTR